MLRAGAKQFLPIFNLPDHATFFQVSKKDVVETDFGIEVAARPMLRQRSTGKVAPVEGKVRIPWAAIGSIFEYDDGAGDLRPQKTPFGFSTPITELGGEGN